MSRDDAHLLVLTLASAIALASASGARADIEDHLERDWYYVETLFFRHVTPPDDEDFSHHGAPRHRLDVAALDPAPAAYLERIDAAPPQPLDFPRLEQFDCIAPPMAPWLEIEDDVESPPEPAATTDEDGDNVRPLPSAAVPPRPTGPPAPLPGQRARWALEEFEQDLMLEGWRWRYDDLSLRATAIRMRRSGDFEVMHHGKWLQAVPPRDRAAPLMIQIGAQMPDTTFELEGSISVTLGRFLHFSAQVWLRQRPPDTQAAPGLAMQPESPGTADSIAHPVKGAPGYVLLSESRRMRPGEFHYLDHPWLGILVRIDPVETPQALLALAESSAED